MSQTKVKFIATCTVVDSYPISDEVKEAWEELKPEYNYNWEEFLRQTIEEEYGLYGFTIDIKT